MQAWVGHTLCQQTLQDVAIDPVEGLCEVDHDAEARADMLLGTPAGLMG